MELSTHNANAATLRWAPFAAWLIQIVAAAPAIETALSDRSSAIRSTASIVAWVWWAAGALALLAPSAVALTAVRMLAPVGLVGVAIAGIAGGPTALELGVALASTAAAGVLVFNAELGRRFVQGSAYGDETRFPLRPPGALVAGPVPILWATGAALAFAGPLLLAAGQWIVGVALTAIAVAWGSLLARRFHRLARRWLVFVPAGVVVHDHTVLAETSMFQRNALAGCALAPASTEAADLTGNALGTAVEFRLRTGGDKVVLAASPKHPQGRALHVRSFLVSPSLPGAALAEARRRGIPPFDDSVVQAAVPPPSTS